MSTRISSWVLVSLITTFAIAASIQITKKHIDDKCTKDEDESIHLEGWIKQLPSHVRREQEKEKRRRKKMPLLAMKGVMYDNITMLCPNGTHLSKISAKKANWYVDKGLASYRNLNDDGCHKKKSTFHKYNAIQLNFEPKKRSGKECYGKADKENICVSCGSDQHPMRFYIVPYSYRCLFPPEYKSHMSHDVVLLCGNCHLRCGKVTQERMKSIEENFPQKDRYICDQNLYKVRSAALALMNSKHKIPESKVVELEMVVRQYGKSEGWWNKDIGTNQDIYSAGFLEQCLNVKYRIERTDYIPSAHLVVQSLRSDQDYSIFVREWRQTFLETLHPRFLPDGWSIDHPVRSA